MLHVNLKTTDLDSTARHHPTVVHQWCDSDSCDCDSVTVTVTGGPVFCLGLSAALLLLLLLLLRRDLSLESNTHDTSLVLLVLLYRLITPHQSDKPHHMCLLWQLPPIIARIAFAFSMVTCIDLGGTLPPGFILFRLDRKALLVFESSKDIPALPAPV